MDSHMDYRSELNRLYEECLSDHSQWSSDRVIGLDLKLLHELNLLSSLDFDEDEALAMRYFQLFEAQDKITLVNGDFIVWIVPGRDEESEPQTTVLIAVQRAVPRVEMVMIARGVYNSSRFILRTLERLLYEMQEAEAAVKEFER